MLMLDADADEARQNEVIERMRQIVEQGGGTFESVDAWGRLKLAYEIDHKGEAFYHIVNFTSSTETLDEVTRVLRITDDVMRHMVVRRTGRSHGKAGRGSGARVVGGAAVDASAPDRRDAWRRGLRSCTNTRSMTS
jgi:small subunit ribosomal protein S6